MGAFIISPTVLRDNFGQAAACMRSQETRLKKQGRIDDFNAAFGDIVKRGVFKELTVAENIEWEGPVNYVSIVVWILLVAVVHVNPVKSVSSGQLF